MQNDIINGHIRNQDCDDLAVNPPVTSLMLLHEMKITVSDAHLTLSISGFELESSTICGHDLASKHHHEYQIAMGYIKK